jgi:DNA-directed RNA polymerase specialized sigma24 family protein
MQSPRAWTVRVAINYLRRLHRRSDGVVAPADVVQPVDVYPDVWVAVQALPERQRTAVVLRYIGDLTENQVANAMRISRGAVSASLVEARRTLSSLLSTDEEEFDGSRP